jgi:hypothetical protein
MNEAQLQAAMGATKCYPHQFVGVIPFTREITSNDPIEGADYIPYGSTLFASIARELGWRGLHHDLDTMTYSAAVENRNDMLNGEMIMSASDALEFLFEDYKSNPSRHWFIRPAADLKQFSGYVDSNAELGAHLSSMMMSYDRGELGSYALNPSTKVVLAEPKVIDAEWRWFVVGGKIVSGSMYRAHGQLRKLRELDQDVVNEAQSLADAWLPMDCVVMDTALVRGRFVKVVEFNCINCSGFYENDVDAVFKALWDHHAK